MDYFYAGLDENNIVRETIISSRNNLMGDKIKPVDGYHPEYRNQKKFNAETGQLEDYIPPQRVIDKEAFLDRWPVGVRIAIEAGAMKDPKVAFLKTTVMAKQMINLDSALMDQAFYILAEAGIHLTDEEKAVILA